MESGLSVIDIAKKIFQNEARPKGSLMLQLEDSDNEYIYQIILTLVLEGLYIKGYVKDGDINMTNNEFIDFIKYIESIGFKLHYDKSEYSEYISLTEEKYKNRYCSIYLKDGGYNMGLNLNFYKQNIDFNDPNKLNLYVSAIVNKDVVYYISFSYDR